MAAFMPEKGSMAIFRPERRSMADFKPEKEGHGCPRAERRSSRLFLGKKGMGEEGVPRLFSGWKGSINATSQG